MQNDANRIQRCNQWLEFKVQNQHNLHGERNVAGLDSSITAYILLTYFSHVVYWHFKSILFTFNHFLQNPVSGIFKWLFCTQVNCCNIYKMKGKHIFVFYLRYPGFIYGILSALIPIHLTTICILYSIFISKLINYHLLL